MNIISRIMGVDKTPEDKYKYIWFTMGTACFALATLVMTIVISRFLGEAKAGMFSIGLSIAQWLVTIAYFEIRTYQDRKSTRLNSSHSSQSRMPSSA